MNGLKVNILAILGPTMLASMSKVAQITFYMIFVLYMAYGLVHVNLKTSSVVLGLTRL
jgi:hypothetical protein